jgi:hypothetical protein
MSNTTPTKYTEYDIHGKGVPKLHHADCLESFLKGLSTKEVYDRLEKTVRSGPIDSFAPHAVNASLAKLDTSDVIELVPILKKCFPDLTFRVSGNFIYGPGDAIDEHTNSNDPSDTLYITYATGKSKFSYRHSLDDDFIDTHDVVNGITLRAFELTAHPPFTFHKVECEDGYRVSIGLRYVNTTTGV